MSRKRWCGSFSPGVRLGSYEIQSALGAGGMGEVYRARDHELGRDVALKVLASAHSGDANHLARLRREATTLAALNHPHIAQIYGIVEGQLDATPIRALVLELVEGETLADRRRNHYRRSRVRARRATDRRGARSGARARHDLQALTEVNLVGPVPATRQAMVYGWLPAISDSGMVLI